MPRDMYAPAKNNRGGAAGGGGSDRERYRGLLDDDGQEKPKAGGRPHPPGFPPIQRPGGIPPGAPLPSKPPRKGGR